MLTLRTEMVRREQDIRATFEQALQSLRREVSNTHHWIVAIVDGARTQIGEEARQAVAPVAAEYGRAVSATSAQLHGAGRTVWMWFIAAGTTLLLAALVGWTVLGYYRRELAQTQDRLARYENAIPVAQAFHASDAIVCGDRICVDVDPNGQRHGDRKRYRQAKPRPQQ